jgi:hypothetical protein
MHPIVRLVGIGVVFFVTTIAWMIFGGVMEHRTRSQTEDLRGRVSDLWGQPQRQKAPSFVFRWTHDVEESHREVIDGETREIRRTVTRTDDFPQSAASTDVDVDLDLDQRLKGLMWYALYDVDFDGRWNYTHEDERDGHLRIEFAFPDPEGLYDGFRFVVDSEDRARSLRPQNGRITFEMPVTTGQEVSLAVAYRSRGMSEWRYVPSEGVSSLEDFSLDMTTDFEDIDYPTLSMSPSSRDRDGEGWRLAWTFDRIVTGHQIGMVMPVPIQPGELASKLSFSAPISLLFFFLMLFVLGTMRGIDIHPINYLFLGASFFAFHLLFGYTVDQTNVFIAFAIASVVSILLVVSYLRLVVSPRFACVEASIAQLIYLIGFSMAHFWDGYTGLTVTILSVATLFILMQLTGRVRWSEALSLKRPGPNDPVPLDSERA